MTSINRLPQQSIQALSDALKSKVLESKVLESKVLDALKSEVLDTAPESRIQSLVAQLGESVYRSSPPVIRPTLEQQAEELKFLNEQARMAGVTLDFNA